MMKHFSYFFVLILVLLLTACNGFSVDSNSSNSSESNGDNASSEPIELNFWTFWGSEERRTVIEKIIKDFNESQDEIIVKHTYVPWSDIFTKNLSAIAAGDPPDVIINDINSLRVRASEGQVEPITEYVDDEVQSRFYDQLFDAAVVDDEIYALPFNTDNSVMFYNVAHLEEAGLSTEDLPETWEEVDAYAQALDIQNDEGYERIGFYPLIRGSISLWMVNALGENYISPEGEININNPEVHSAYEWVLQSQEKYGKNYLDSVNARFDNAQQDPFMSGEVSILVRNANYNVQLRNHASDLEFVTSPLPQRELGAKPASIGGGFVAEIPKGASNPEASYQFIEYITNYDSQLYWAENNFDLMANEQASIDAAESTEFNNTDQKVYNTMVDNMENTVLTLIPLGAPDYGSTLHSIFDEIINGSETVEDGIPRAQSEMERMFNNE